MGVLSEDIGIPLVSLAANVPQFLFLSFSVVVEICFPISSEVFCHTFKSFGKITKLFIYYYLLLFIIIYY